MKNLLVILTVLSGIMTVSAQSVLADLEATPELSTFLSACKAADIENMFQTDAEYTLFAPSNEAFAALPVGKLEYLLAEENRKELVELISHHIVPGTFVGDELATGKSMTLQGEEIDINLVGEEIKVNGARVRNSDVQLKNITVHVIDQIVLPMSQVKN